MLCRGGYWQLEHIRTRGYSINAEGLSIGITAVGAAIVHPTNGRPVAAVSISGPSSRITPDYFESYGSAIHNAAESITTSLM